jgi:hypothetical protein
MVEKLYRCGDCPVCSFLGELVLLEALDSRVLFVFCPSCGCAFERPVENINEPALPESHGPRGFVLPGREQVRIALDLGWRPRFLAVLDTEWQERLGPGFRQTSAAEGRA